MKVLQLIPIRNLWASDALKLNSEAVVDMFISNGVQQEGIEETSCLSNLNFIKPS
jgi:hypothetical protein